MVFLEGQPEVPIPNPNDLDSVAGYAAGAMDPTGSSPGLWIEIRRSLQLPPVKDEKSAQEVVAAQIAIGRAIYQRR